MINQNKDWLTELIERTNKNTQQNIKTSYLAQIIKLTIPTCSVQPLAMIHGKKLPMVENVHFITYLPLQYKVKYIDSVGAAAVPKKRLLDLTNKKLNYKKGDTVLVDVLDLDDSYFRNKGKFNVGSVRRHSIDYSVIVGKIADKKDFKFKK